MKKITLLALAAVIALPLSSYALGFLTIKNASIIQIDPDTYRLRADVDWGGPTILASNIVVPSNSKYVSNAEVNLSAFQLGGVPGAYNHFASISADKWGAGATSGWEGTDFSRYEYWQPLEYDFGFDFKHTGPLPQLIHLDFVGQLEWAYTYKVVTRKSSFNMYDIAYSEMIQGGYDLRLTAPIPEPATALLFAVGMIGTAVASRRRRSIK